MAEVEASRTFPSSLTIRTSPTTGAWSAGDGFCAPIFWAKTLEGTPPQRNAASTAPQSLLTQSALMLPQSLRRSVAQGRCPTRALWGYYVMDARLAPKRLLVLPINPVSERYSRQILFAGMGEEGQRKLLASRAVIVGCGAIGASAAQLLARAGVARLRVLDRDFVEPSNLQRQALFDESDARESLPKAVAAQQKLRAINSAISIEGIVADLTPQNAQELLSGFDLLLDGTDNFEARFLLNDYAVKHNRPWIYAAAVGSYGVTLTVRPGLTACLACLLEVANIPAG